MMKNFWYYPCKSLPPWFWKQYKEGGWNNFLSGQIVYILASQPQLHSYFDLRKLEGWEINQILAYQPQLKNLFSP